MQERSGYRQLQLLRNASLWQKNCEARTPLSIYLSDHDTRANATLSRYRDYLGHEFEHVWIDCREGLHADAIAALCGTITAGGVLSILLPTNGNTMSQRMEHFAAEFYSEHIADTHPEMLIKPGSPGVPMQLTSEQQTILNSIEGPQQQTTHIITAERGRGKSTLLGRALTRVKDQQAVIVTAPRKANANVLLQQAPHAKFIAWDKLLEQPDDPAKQLVIDEAAGLPLWATAKLCQKYTPWLLATTVAGYEGCGRGFAVHFTEWAQRTLPQVALHQLTQPLRWPLRDPLEQWLTETFLLSEQPITNSVDAPTGTFIVHASELEENVLRQCFQLLLNAHYQSSPNDLHLLLTEPGHRVAYQCRSGKVVAVAWLMDEGPIPVPLKQDILQGRRRPKGNLLPQAIGYFLQQEWAMDIRWLRVARIAVPTGERRQKVASTLLDDTREWARSNHYQMLGTSFAWSEQLDAFWQKNSYQPCRFSSRIDSVSARPAAIYIQPLSASSVAQYRTLGSWGQQQQQWLSVGVKALASTEALGEIRTPLINAYTANIIPFDAAHFALAQWFYWHHPEHHLAELLCQPTMTLKRLSQCWDGISQRQANENLCKEVQTLR
ncbi:GNAT family N-acetyltransferase [Idiomarina sp. HP20-50]|uniref:GNAT family N-acetyltransferase n=1 Tax=Idiomarina sp. HP20-50 TaxID=3070813 RepID=UPI00294AC4EC|nr:GNAT family N-acetyltransferase [Idiomarina sp. HP20-50]MDV6315795.1 GNAT family N-acetyltransferase [Idiomarina sp. HP20-50]